MGGTYRWSFRGKLLALALTVLIPAILLGVYNTGRLEQVLTNVLDNAVKYSPGAARSAWS